MLMNDDQEKRLSETLRRGLTRVESNEAQPAHGQPIPRRPKPDPAQTYFGRMQAGLVEGTDVGYLVGSEAQVRPPFAPSPIAWDIDNIEPSLGIDVTTVEDMTVVPHGGSALLPPEQEQPRDE
jgi:hypothetical protein